MSERTCNNCKLYKRGDCGGLGNAMKCKDYDGVPTISAEEIKSWPSYGDASALRFGNNKELRRRGLKNY